MATKKSQRTLQSSAANLFGRVHPEMTIAFALLLIARIFAAITSPIQDCDETFNFLEPTHFLMHGYGLETWEFSPEYRIRSWFYIVLHALPVYSISLLPVFTTKLIEFYVLRMTLALFSTVCELLLFVSLTRYANPRIGILFLIVVITTPGFFHASVAYLPSSFAMYTVMLAMREFLLQPRGSATTRSIMWLSIGVVVGWPFVGILAIPFLVDEVLEWMNGGSLYSMIARLAAGAIRATGILTFETAVDSIFYRSFTSVPFNIVWYNVFATVSKGPDIFGTEPWHFYIRNLLINFNLWFLLAILAAPLILMYHFIYTKSPSKLGLTRSLVLVASFYIWLMVFSLQPHKEERFMYPAYPLLAINSAISLHILILIMSSTSPKTFLGYMSTSTRLTFSIGFILVCTFLGVWRTIGLATAYSAPFSVYSTLELAEATQSGDFVCVGKEWYRFPSSYHLPHTTRLKFIRSEFRGLLPGEFDESTEKGWGVLPPTWTTPLGMNDRNQEDPLKYTDLSQCKYLVDFSSSGTQPTDVEPDYVRDSDRWEEIKCEKFLDAKETGLVGRLFWIPDFEFLPKSWLRKWGSYCLLKRRLRET